MPSIQISFYGIQSNRFPSGPQVNRCSKQKRSGGAQRSSGVILWGLWISKQNTICLFKISCFRAKFDGWMDAKIKNLSIKRLKCVTMFMLLSYYVANRSRYICFKYVPAECHCLFHTSLAHITHITPLYPANWGSVEGGGGRGTGLGALDRCVCFHCSELCGSGNSQRPHAVPPGDWL